MRKNKLIFITILILAGTYLAYTFNLNKNNCFVILNNQKFNVSVAKTDAEKQLGLSGTTSLAQNTGKLFIFDELGNHGFWMKDMNYPIDIVWFDQNWSVVGLAKNATPESYPNVFYPEHPAQYVLEINAGVAEKLNLGFGSVAGVSCEEYLK